MGSQLIAGALISAFLLSLNTAQASSTDAAKNLRNFALSNCLYQAFPESEAGTEAKAAAGGYVEIGSLDADAYADAAELAKKYLQTKYESKSEQVKLTVMKCIDLSQSDELEAILKEYTQGVQKAENQSQGE